MTKYLIILIFLLSSIKVVAQKEALSPRNGNNNNKAQHCIMINCMDQLINGDNQLSKHQWQHYKSKTGRIYAVPFDEFF